METGIGYQNDMLVVSGELNFVTVVNLWKDSLPKLNNYSTLHFNLANVTASNSAGLALILEWIKYAKRHNKPISFTNIPEHLTSILQVAGMQQMMASFN
jgi:phospholipid transport system transporter-binding protein